MSRPWVRIPIPSPVRGHNERHSRTVIEFADNRRKPTAFRFAESKSLSYKKPVGFSGFLEGFSNNKKDAAATAIVWRYADVAQSGSSTATVGICWFESNHLHKPLWFLEHCLKVGKPSCAQ